MLLSIPPLWPKTQNCGHSRSASILLLSFDPMPASERSVSRRATSACKDGTSIAVRRASFVSSTASLSLRRQALNRDFHELPSLRAATSAQRSSSARASPASARARSRSSRARSRSHCDRQSRGACSGTDTGDNRTPPLPSNSVRLVPKSSSRTAMSTTIAHGKSRYQQKDSTLWGLASTWEMRLTGPIPRPERTVTLCDCCRAGLHKSLDQYRPASTLTQPPTRFIPSVSCRVMRLPTSGQTSRPIPMFSKAALSQGEYWDLDRESRRVRRAGRKVDRFRRSRIPNCSVCRSLPVGGTHQVGRDPEHISRPFSEVSWTEVTCSAHGHDWTSRSLSRRRNGCTRSCAARRCNLQFQT